MTRRIDDIIEGLIKREGGYVDHPADRGGPTMFGITQSVARAAGYRGPMREMPRVIAQRIYREQYIDGPGFGRLASLSEEIAEELIDTAVNMGPSVAGRFLQRILNALNHDGRSYPDITVDGRCGPQTRGALQACMDAREAAERLVMLGLNVLQGNRYIEIAEGDASQEAFLAGWLMRRVTL